MFLAAVGRGEDGPVDVVTLDKSDPPAAGRPVEDVASSAILPDLARTRGPLEIRAVPEALPGSVFRGELQLVSPSIDPQSGSFRVTVLMGPPIDGPKDAHLLPGMLVRLEIVTERHPDAFVVPKRALRREGEQNLVFVLDGTIARRVEVIEGFSDDASVEVRAVTPGGITAGRRVIVVGNRELEDGAEVTEEDTSLDTTKSAPPPEPQKG
jgi:membrane fusion protein (multidrug efflux system)